jgi:hypothetical protein
VPDRSLASCLVALILGCAVSGCLFMPRDGTEVYVEARTGRTWSGAAKLVEVSPDERFCKVVVRGRALFVEKRWVDCRHVHPRRVF